ncbi:MAG: UDP-N-acetylmuramate--L-alanine ligase [Aquificae bacterium]|nr:UDP-N-acetylmuramate--L-alanine ligase [Aquificota bacterium]
MLRERVKRVHFVGIGGIGMSGLAQILLEMGYRVTGSDLKESKTVELLRKKGVRVFIGHRPEHVRDAQVVVYSSAVKPDNPEIVEAKRLNLPVVPRGEMLAELFKLKEGIAVSGSHGKTTTTSMIAEVLINAGLEPTVLVGGRLKRLGTNAKLGQGELLVSEADESDGSFLKLSPAVAVVTNVDREHLDFYESFEAIKKAFESFVNAVPFYGFAVLNADDEALREIRSRTHERVITFGLSKDVHARAEELKLENGRYAFNLVWKGRPLGRVKLGIAGRHNVYNALAAAAVCLELGVPFTTIKRSLEEFKNAERRLDFKGYYGSAPVYDDYGHHPTEIKAVLSSLKELYPDRELVVLFQPHRYSRTHYLFDEFVRVLKGVPHLIVTDVYPAGERNLWGVSAERLAREAGAYYAPTKEEALKLVKKLARKDRVVLFLGAGSVSRWCEELLSDEKA